METETETLQENAGNEVLTLQESAPPSTISFCSGAEPEDLLFTVHADGKIEKGPAFTTQDEASLKFWELTAEAFPLFRAKLMDVALESLAERRIGFTCEKSGVRYEFQNTAELIMAFLKAKNGEE